MKNKSALTKMDCIPAVSTGQIGTRVTGTQTGPIHKPVDAKIVKIIKNVEHNNNGKQDS